MPKATKLHVKGKSNTLQKPCKVEKDGPEGVDPEESMRQFQLELCWCIQQLERSLREKKGNEKQSKYLKLPSKSHYFVYQVFQQLTLL